MPPGKPRDGARREVVDSVEKAVRDRIVPGLRYARKLVDEGRRRPNADRLPKPPYDKSMAQREVEKKHRRTR